MEETNRPIHGNQALQQSYGPEVVHDYHAAQAPEVVKQENIPYVLPAPYKYDQTGNYQPEHYQGEQPPNNANTDSIKKRICGLTVLVFWLVIAAIVVVIAVAIGVGVAVGMRSSNNSQTSTPTNAPQVSSSSLLQSSTTTNPTTTTSSTTTTSAAPTQTYVTSGDTGLSANSCNFTVPRTFVAKDGTTFTQYCFTDWPRGVATSDGLGQVADLTFTTLYTFEDCMEACLVYNQQIDSTDTKCRAVTYNSNLTSIVAGQGGNCFLKNKKGVDQPGSAESACAVIV